VVELDAKVLALEREIFSKGREATTATETKTITVAVEVRRQMIYIHVFRYIHTYTHSSFHTWLRRPFLRMDTGG
jgi:hypothetical protein